MKTLILTILGLILSFIVHSQVNVKQDAIIVYERALSEIRKSPEFHSYIKELPDNKLSISAQLLPQYVLSRFFLKEQNIDFIEFSTAYFNKNFRDEIVEDKRLPQLICLQNTNITLYFTTIEDHRLFAEVIYTPGKEKKYAIEPVLGLSLCYFIELGENRIKSYKAKIISNN
jgi:hypothetical protein